MEFSILQYLDWFVTFFFITIILFFSFTLLLLSLELGNGEWGMGMGMESGMAVRTVRLHVEHVDKRADKAWAAVILCGVCNLLALKRRGRRAWGTEGGCQRRGM